VCVGGGGGVHVCRYKIVVVIVFLMLYLLTSLLLHYWFCKPFCLCDTPTMYVIVCIMQ
jgi:hypothetical protein